MKPDAQKLSKLKELTRQAVVFGEFTFSGGRRSGNKVEFEEVSRTDNGQALLAHLVPEVLLERRWFSLDAIGGPDGGAYPISLAALRGIATLPARSRCHTFRVGKKEESLPEGHVIRPGFRVVVVDDVATTGMSLLRAARACRKVGAKVLGAFVVVDREEGAEELLSSEGIQLASLFHLSDLL